VILVFQFLDALGIKSKTLGVGKLVIRLVWGQKIVGSSPTAETIMENKLAWLLGRIANLYEPKGFQFNSDVFLQVPVAQW
jgi:hypothetical protein